jgi:hypothetical protein
MAAGLLSGLTPAAPLYRGSWQSGLNEASRGSSRTRAAARLRDAIIEDWANLPGDRDFLFSGFLTAVNLRLGTFELWNPDDRVSGKFGEAVRSALSTATLGYMYTGRVRESVRLNERGRPRRHLELLDLRVDTGDSPEETE